jgi:transposase
MGERRVFTKEFKENAVELARTSGRKQQDVAKDLGIDGNTLARWKREAENAKDGTIKAFPGKGKARDEELVQLRRRVADLEETNEILKKAIAIFTPRTGSSRNPR